MRNECLSVRNLLNLTFCVKVEVKSFDKSAA